MSEPAASTDTDALDRLAVAEANLREAREASTKLEQRLAATEAANASLQAAVDAQASREQARRESEVGAYVASLQARARPCAIPEDKLAHVRTLFGAGLDTEARAMGEALVGALEASSSPGTRTVSLDTEPDQQKATAGHVAAQLRAAGWKVELSADGSQILSKTPPVRGGR